MKCYITGRNYISLQFLSAKLFKFEIQKCGQILCAHKPYFLMPGHIYTRPKVEYLRDNHAYIHLLLQYDHNLINTEMHNHEALYVLPAGCMLHRPAILNHEK